LVVASLFLKVADAEAPETELPEINIQDYAKFRVSTTWSEDEWEAFNKIITQESGWTHNTSHNLSLSTAYGLGGFLDGTWKTVEICCLFQVSLLLAHLTQE